MDKEQAENLASHSLLTTLSHIAVPPVRTKKYQISLGLTRSPWFEHLLMDLSISLLWLCKSQLSTFPTWPHFPQWSSAICFLCCSCRTSGWEDPLAPGLPRAQCGYSSGAQGVWFASLHFLLWNFNLLRLLFVFVWLPSYWKFSSSPRLPWMSSTHTYTCIIRLVITSNN